MMEEMKNAEPVLTLDSENVKVSPLAMYSRELVSACSGKTVILRGISVLMSYSA